MKFPQTPPLTDPPSQGTVVDDTTGEAGDDILSDGDAIVVI